MKNMKKILLDLNWMLMSFCLLFLFHSGVCAYGETNQAKETLIKGIILDSKTREPMIGVSILVTGTSIGTLSDMEGNYKLSVPSTAKSITFRFMGYEEQVLSFAPGKVNDFRVIEMIESDQMLEEVTVVAFGKQKKESVVGSVTSVKVSDLRVPSSNLTTSFAGRVAGLIAYQTTGEPGQDDAQFFVRGVTTFGTGKSDPLILIDNVELTSADLARLNTDDIASFSVLKDATATALYGARGANGVILVTTKEGKEGKVKISARYEASYSSSTKDIELASPIAFMEMYNEAIRTRDPLAPLEYTQSSIEARKKGLNPYVYPTVDWQSMILKDATLNHKANINLSGGGKMARYYVALGYTRDNGLLNVDPVNNFNNNISLNKYVVRANVNMNLSKSTELAVRISGSFDDYQGPIDGGAAMYEYAIKANPVLFPAYYLPDEANKHANHILFGNSGTDALYMNPYAEMLRGYKQYNTTTVIAQLELKQDLDFLVKGLRARVMANATSNSYFDIKRAYSPFYYNVASYDKATDSYTLNPLNDEGANAGTDYLNYNQNNGTRTVKRSFYGEAQVNYDRTFADTHTLGALLVFAAREDLQGNAKTLEESLASRNMNLSGRFTYGYDDRYFGEFNFGYNGSEKFDENHRWGFFPSVGVSWMLSNERFWARKSISRIMPSFKLKATYGLVGNDAISKDRFFYLSQVNMKDAGKGYTFGYNFGKTQQGISISRYADTQIGWEVAHKFDVGAIINFFNKIDLEVDYFTERRTNVLQTRADIPSTMGLQAVPKANIGEAKGKGIDISLNASHFFNKDFWIKAIGNFTYATSKFSIYEEPDYSATTPWLSHQGQKISQQWGLIAERLFVDEEDVANSAQQQFGEYMAGDIKYKDINKDGLIDERDKVPIGYPTTPEIIYGFGLSSGFKNFDFSVFFQGSGRSSFFIEPNKIAPFVDTLNKEVTSRIGYNGVLKFIEQDHWTEENQNIYAAWPRLSTKSVRNNNQLSTWWLHDGSFLRLKSVEIGYNMPQKIARKMALESLRFYFSGTNLVTFSNFKLWDVEMKGNGLAYPNQRVLSLGINVTL